MQKHNHYPCSTLCAEKFSKSQSSRKEQANANPKLPSERQFDEIFTSTKNATTTEEGFVTARNSMFLTDEIQEAGKEELPTCAPKNKNDYDLDDEKNAVVPLNQLKEKQDYYEDTTTTKTVINHEMITATKTLSESDSKNVNVEKEIIENITDDDKVIWNVKDQSVVTEETSSSSITSSSLEHEKHQDDLCQTSNDAKLSEDNIEEITESDLVDELKESENSGLRKEQIEEAQQEIFEEQVQESEEKTHDILDMQKEFVQNSLSIQDNNNCLNTPKAEHSKVQEDKASAQTVMDDINLKNDHDSSITTSCPALAKTFAPNAEDSVNNADDFNEDAISSQHEQSNYKDERKETKAISANVEEDEHESNVHDELKNATSNTDEKTADKDLCANADSETTQKPSYYIPPAPPPPPPGYLVKLPPDPSEKVQKPDKPKLSAAEKALIKELETINDPTFVGFLKTQLKVKNFTRDRNEQQEM